MAVCGNGSRIPVVDKHHTMAHEDSLFDSYAFANKGVTRYLTSSADRCAFLYLDKSADLRPRSDLATVQIHELGMMYHDSFAELHVVCDHISTELTVQGRVFLCGLIAHRKAQIIDV